MLFFGQMSNQFYFQPGIMHIKPVYLHPGSSRKITFVKNFTSLVILLHRFYIRSIQVFLHHILKSSAIVLQRFSNLSYNCLIPSGVTFLATVPDI